MINIIGILIIVSGFFLPYHVDMLLPSPFFWIGGLLSLNKGILIRGEYKWAKWAQIGILLHIAVNFLSIIINLLIGYGSITEFEYWLTMALYWISGPATLIGKQIFPYPEMHYPDGSVVVEISYHQTLITAFLNVVIFAVIPVLVGTLRRKKTAK
jgi:hypothetical protein